MFEEQQAPNTEHQVYYCFYEVITHEQKPGLNFLYSVSIKPSFLVLLIASQVFEIKQLIFSILR